MDTLTKLFIFFFVADLCNVLESSKELPPCLESCVDECICPSLSAPGNLSLSLTPQFITLFTDEVVNEKMFRRIIELTTRTKNHNGCDVPITWYVRSQHSDPDIIRNAYNRYYEVAISAVVEAGDPAEQIKVARHWLTRKAGIPGEDLRGFRSPPWSNSSPFRNALKENGLEYDNSIVEPVGGRSVSRSVDTRLWPYSLDNGIAQDCSKKIARCHKNEVHEGVIEIPEWMLQSETGRDLHDVFSEPHWRTALQKNFLDSYYGNRAPLSIPLSSRFLLSSNSNVNEFAMFMAEVLEYDDVWFITNSQLIDFMKEPMDSESVHELLQCGGRKHVGAECLPPEGGCDRGTYDYSLCRCECTNADNPVEYGFCLDDTKRCTIAQQFNEELGEFYCKTAEVNEDIEEAYGVFSGLTPESGILIGLFVVLGLIALFGLYKGVRAGMKRARALAGDSMILSQRNAFHSNISFTE